jgi:hypothetical protein
MQALVRQWGESGLRQGKFAAKQSTILVKLRYWIHKLKSATDDDSAFIQLNGFGIQGINLQYPNGVELTLTVQTPVRVLRSLFQF